MSGHGSLAVPKYKCVSDTKCEKVNNVMQGTSSDTARSVASVTTTASSIESSDGKVSFTINLNLNETHLIAPSYQKCNNKAIWG